MKLRALSCARRASGPAASTPPQGVSTPSTGTCSSLQQLLNALLASSPAARAVGRGKRNEAYHEHRRRRAVEAAYLVRRPRGTRPPFFSWTGAGTHDDDEPSEIEQRELEIRILMLT